MACRASEEVSSTQRLHPAPQNSRIGSMEGSGRGPQADPGFWSDCHLSRLPTASPLPPPVSSCAMGLHCRPGDCLVLSAACTHLQSRAVAKSQLVQSNASSRASHCFVIRHLGAAIGAGGTSTRICQAQPDPPGEARTLQRAPR